MSAIPAILALENGEVFQGIAIGATGQAVGEVVFNTAMTGYQEILTDPSYAQQIVTLTYPHIGSVGTNADDQESDQVWAQGLVIRDLPLLASNWRDELPLDAYLKKHNVVAIADIDTRALTNILREQGAQRGCILAGDVDPQKAIELAKSFPGLNGMDLAQDVTAEKSYEWTKTTWKDGNGKRDKSELPYYIVAYDYGIKQNILRLLVASGCRITVVPAKTSAEDVLALQPDGVFLSNGPGDPAPCEYAIDAIKILLNANMPLFGICLGHQLLSLACGAQTIKMKFGHHGANHPVQDIATKRVMITSQNHGFTVDEKTLPANLVPTHRSLFDGSLQGVRHTEKPAFSFQGHPEASPGPHDIHYIMQSFVDLIEENKKTHAKT